MPNRVQWDPNFSVGNDVLDDQHRQLLAQCNALADYCLTDDSESDNRKFQLAFDELMAAAREHFTTEAALLAACGYPDLDEYQHECDEYGYLAAEIVTMENFDKLELQRFLVLWWTGHIVSAARRQRACLTK